MLSENGGRGVRRGPPRLAISPILRLTFFFGLFQLGAGDHIRKGASFFFATFGFAGSETAIFWGVEIFEGTPLEHQHVERRGERRDTKSGCSYYLWM